MTIDKHIIEFPEEIKSLVFSQERINSRWPSYRNEENQKYLMDYLHRFNSKHPVKVEEFDEYHDNYSKFKSQRRLHEGTLILPRSTTSDEPIQIILEREWNPHKYPRNEKGCLEDIDTSNDRIVHGSTLQNMGLGYNRCTVYTSTGAFRHADMIDFPHEWYYMRRRKSDRYVDDDVDIRPLNTTGKNNNILYCASHSQPIGLSEDIFLKATKEDDKKYIPLIVELDKSISVNLQTLW
jgi:hypothetical protein